MAKNNIKDVAVKGSVAATITNSLNKHGEIKGKNKKETKNLKAICTHHKIKKNGKIKGTFWNDGDGTCGCEMCGSKWRTRPYSKDEVKEIMVPVKEFLSHMRFMAQACDLGNETISYLANASIAVEHLPKTYEKIKHVAVKANNVKNKKKNNGGKNNKSGSENYGGWRL